MRPEWTRPWRCWFLSSSDELTFPGLGVRTRNIHLCVPHLVSHTYVHGGSHTVRGILATVAVSVPPCVCASARLSLGVLLSLPLPLAVRSVSWRNPVYVMVSRVAPSPKQHPINMSGGTLIGCCLGDGGMFDQMTSAGLSHKTEGTGSGGGSDKGMHRNDELEHQHVEVRLPQGRHDPSLTHACVCRTLQLDKSSSPTPGRDIPYTHWYGVCTGCLL